LHLTLFLVSSLVKRRFGNPGFKPPIFSSNRPISKRRKGIFKACKIGEIKIGASGLQPEKAVPVNGEKIMRTVIYYQGFNRIENRNIIRLEQAKLNRLLDEERRVIETLIGSIKQQIEAAPHRLFDVRLIWNKLNNHTIVQSIRQKINLLTDAYPQFLSQVIAMHRRLEEKAIETLQVVRQIAQKSILCQ
jgi:hypothetical protein